MNVKISHLNKFFMHNIENANGVLSEGQFIGCGFEVLSLYEF